MSPMTRCLLAVLTLVFHATVALAAPKPNVLFLFTDDQRADTIHALGNELIQTPNIDRLVRGGISFNNAYCQGGYSPAVCLPSRQSTLSGRTWFVVRDLPAVLSVEVQTLP